MNLSNKDIFDKNSLLKNSCEQSRNSNDPFQINLSENSDG